MPTNNDRSRGSAGRLRRFGAHLLHIAAVCCTLGALTAAAAPAGGAAVPLPDFRLFVTPSKLVVPVEQLSTPQVLEVRNEGRATQDLTVHLSAFVQHPDGTVGYEQNTPYSAVGWLTVTPAHATLAPGTRAQFTVHLAVPGNADPGDHDVAISFVAPPANASGNIRIAEAVGVTAVITVPGTTVNRVAVTRVQTSGFSGGGPITLTATVQNTGTVHRTFDNALDPLSAHANGTTIDFGHTAVLRGATRIVTATWNSPPVFCVCHISVTIPNAGGRPSTASATVVVLPVYGIAITLAALATGLTVLLQLRRLYRRRLAAAVETGRLAARGAPHGNAPETAWPGA